MIGFGSQGGCRCHYIYTFEDHELATTNSVGLKLNGTRAHNSPEECRYKGRCEASSMDKSSHRHSGLPRSAEKWEG